MLGGAKWQAARVEAWRTSLMDTVLVRGRGVEVLPAMPFSHAVPAGKWRWGKLPENCLPVLDAIYASAFGEHALAAGETEIADELDDLTEVAEAVALG